MKVTVTGLVGSTFDNNDSYRGGSVALNDPATVVFLYETGIVPIITSSSASGTTQTMRSDSIFGDPQFISGKITLGGKTSTVVPTTEKLFSRTAMRAA